MKPDSYFAARFWAAFITPSAQQDFSMAFEAQLRDISFSSSAFRCRATIFAIAISSTSTR
nr:MAG TPA: hypothetical protein [Caudoviricetes sp.]